MSYPCVSLVFFLRDILSWYLRALFISPLLTRPSNMGGIADPLANPAWLNKVKINKSTTGSKRHHAPEPASTATI